MILLAISGKKRSGKNTIAKLIAQQTPLRCEEFAFADALKQEVASACGIDVRFIEDHKDIFRIALQWWGTDFRRTFKGQDYWCKQLLVKTLKSTADIALVTDCRFVDEADCMRRIDGKVIRVNNPHPTTYDSHKSEIDLDSYKFDYTISNDSSIESLAAKVKLMLQHFNIKTGEAEMRCQQVSASGGL